MREIKAQKITEVIARLVQSANFKLPDDVTQKIEESKHKENNLLAKQTLQLLQENAKIAKETLSPICQDTGMAMIIMKIGQDVHIQGCLEEAINEGVRQGYRSGFLRKSIVKDPVLHRNNTKDNTPANIHYEIVKGDKIEIIVAPKGFGSENMCQLKMMKPSDGIEGVKQFVLDVVKEAGPNPCPPILIGVGIGGSFDSVAYLAKVAMLKNIYEKNENREYALLEKEWLESVNQLDIGPAGYGGKTTALALHIETKPTHIAGMPVAVAICCHVARMQREIL